MLVITRFRVAEEEGGSFRSDLAAAHRVLAAQRGYVAGQVGRNVDDPTLWVLATTWADAGSYRRALSAYDVRVGAPALFRALDEPGAYEVVEPGAELNRTGSRSTGSGSLG